MPAVCAYSDRTVQSLDENAQTLEDRQTEIREEDGDASMDGFLI